MAKFPATVWVCDICGEESTTRCGAIAPNPMAAMMGHSQKTTYTPQMPTGWSNVQILQQLRQVENLENENPGHAKAFEADDDGNEGDKLAPGQENRETYLACSRACAFFAWEKAYGVMADVALGNVPGSPEWKEEQAAVQAAMKAAAETVDLAGLAGSPTNPADPAQAHTPAAVVAAEKRAHDMAQAAMNDPDPLAAILAQAAHRKAQALREAMDQATTGQEATP